MAWHGKPTIFPTRETQVMHFKIRWAKICLPSSPSFFLFLPSTYTQGFQIKLSFYTHALFVFSSENNKEEGEEGLLAHISSSPKKSILHGLIQLLDGNHWRCVHYSLQWRGDCCIKHAYQWKFLHWQLPRSMQTWHAFGTFSLLPSPPRRRRRRGQNWKQLSKAHSTFYRQLSSSMFFPKMKRVASTY